MSAAREQPQIAEDWFTPGRFALLLFAFIALAFPEVLLDAKTFVFRDYGLFTAPVAWHLRDSFWHGELPLWNPLSNCGLPFLAQWNTVALYPLSLLYVALPFTWALGLFQLAHLFLAGIGMYLLAHRWTGHRFAAAVAGVAFAFNGLTLNALMWLSNLAALAWMPWVVLLVEKAWREGGRSLIAAALIATLQMLSGAPEIILFTWLILGTMAVGQCGMRKVECGIEILAGRFLLVVGLVAALSAVQLLPFFELLHHSDRSADFASSDWSMPAWGWANFLVPLFRCYGSSPGVYFQNEQSWTSSYYLGIGVCALALLAFWQSRSRRVWFLGAVTVFSLMMALGDNGPLYPTARALTPAVGVMRYPIKFVVLAGFAVPLLAAFGIREMLQIWDNVGQPVWAKAFAVTALLSLLAGVTIMVAKVHPFSEEVWTTTFRSGATRVVYLLAALAVAFVQTRNRKPRERRILATGFLVLLWLDVATHMPSQNPTVTSNVFNPMPAEVRRFYPQRSAGSRAMLTGGAIFEFKEKQLRDLEATFALNRLGLFDNCNLLDSVPKVDGFFSLFLREERQVQAALYASLSEVRPGMADFLGVSRVTSPTNIFHWQARVNFMPIISAGQRPVFAEAATTLRALAETNFNPRETVFLPKEADAWFDVNQARSAQVTIKEFTAHRIDCETEASEPALVVIAQAHYPCWQAYVDDQPTTLWRANHAYQALQVPPGSHRVRLAYEDTLFRLGAVVSLLALAGCVTAWNWPRRKLSP
jgi:hypothetical protein